MEIKKAKYKEVQVKQKRCVSEAVYGCDHCREEIKNFPNEENRLGLKVFYHEKDTKHLHFCSWDCVLWHLPEIETDYFVSLPYISFDSNPNSRKGIHRLVEIINKMYKL